MGCVKKVIPWVIDPVGTAIHETTGFGYTPGGMVNQMLNPKIPPPRAPSTPIAKVPPIPSPPPPPPPWHPAAQSGQTPKNQHEGAGAGASADSTRGLVVTGQKRGTGRSLLS